MAPCDVAEALLVGHAAGVAGRRGRVARLGPGRVPVVQVRHQRGVAVDRERADDLLRRPVVAGHVVEHHDARLVGAVERAGEVGLDLVAAVAGDRDRLGDDAVGHRPDSSGARSDLDVDDERLAQEPRPPTTRQTPSNNDPEPSCCPSVMLLHRTREGGGIGHRPVRRDRGGRALRGVSDRDAAGPQGLQGARRRPGDVPERHALDARRPPAGRGGAAAMGAARSADRDGMSRRSTRTRSTSVRSRSRAPPAPSDSPVGVLPAADRARQAARRRRGRGGGRGPRGVHRRGGRRSRTAASPAFAATARAARPSPSAPASSSEPTAGTRSSRRRSQPEQYNEKPQLLCGYYTYWSGLPMDGRFEVYIRPGPGMGGGADARRPDARRRRLAVRRVRGQQERRRGQLPEDVRPGARVRRAHPRRQARGALRRHRRPELLPQALRARAGRWSATPATTRTSSPRRGSRDAFRDAELCATALDESFSGARVLRRRDGRVPVDARRARAADVRVHLPARDARAAAARDAAAARAPCTAIRRRWTGSRGSTPG